jgi:hypothetical protein
MTRLPHLKLAAASLAMVVATASPAAAYIGPGAGLGAIAVTAALILGVLLLLTGLVWFPLKRAFKARSRGAADRSDDGK